MSRVPWRDRSGHFSALKTTVFVLLPLPAVLAVVQWASGAFSGHATDFLLLVSGFWSDRLLVVTLAVTPAASLFAFPRLPLVRRMIGLAAGAYALAHLGVYGVQQNFAWAFMVVQMLTVPVLIIGLASVLALAVLAATSTDGWVRRLGKAWKRVHWLAHPATVLALLHSFMEAKAGVDLAATYAGFYLWLVLWRLLPRGRRRHLPTLLMLAPAAAIGTALIEYAWYAVGTSLPAERVLAANLSLEAGLRPAHWVVLAALAVVAAVALHRFATRPRPALNLSPGEMPR